MFCKLCDTVTLYFGYGLDDPRNGDVGFVTLNGPGQRTWNQVIGGTAVWDITPFFPVGFEVSHRETDYLDSSTSNHGLS